jgi:hypothetical protein
LDAGTIVDLMGDPQPFSLVAQGPDAILIYSTNRDAKDDPGGVIEEIEGKIKQLAALHPFHVALRVPHAAALGDLAANVSSLNYKQFTVENVGSDKIRISSSRQPDCNTWKNFLSDIRRLAWQPTPESPVQKLFYLNGSDVASALGGGVSSPGAGGGSSKGSESASGQGGESGKSSGGGESSGGADSGSQAGTTVNVNVGTTANPSGQASGKTATAKGAKSKTGSSSGQPAGTQQSVTANAAGGASNASPSKSAPGGAPSAAQPASTSAAPAGSDFLVFSEATPGNDAAVTEKKRILAQLDMPHPEMLINVWSMQASSTAQEAITELSHSLQHEVTSHNEALQESIGKGWAFLRSQITQPGDFFDPYFWKYIASRYIADSPAPNRAAGSNARAAQEYIDLHVGKQMDPAVRKSLGACENTEYCLGYTGIFQPLQPRLTDLLLTVIAAKSPAEVTDLAINQMEGVSASTTPYEISPEVIAPQKEVKELIRSLALDRVKMKSTIAEITRDKGCEDADLAAIVSEYAKDQHRQPLFLECFRDRVKNLLQPAKAASELPSSLGLLRAAVADFLFNYKMAQQYPHEFDAYYLIQSAQALNTALNPFAEAFNRDVAAYQRFLRAEIELKKEDLNKRCFLKKWLRLDKPTFFNNGLITVRTISGKETVVDTVTQSYLDVTAQPSISDLVKAVEQAQGGGSASSAIPNVIARSLTGNQAEVLVGALSAMQSTQAKIGRELMIDVTPRALSGASSAELELKMHVGETAEPTLYSGGQSAGNDNFSRVATHDTTTKVRVDSLKIFEISSFSALLQRSRSRFPLVPPLVELPYIGTIVGVPIPGAKEYHSSTAVLSAIVVPTAADLAYGLAFVDDHVVAEDQSKCDQQKLPVCSLRGAVALADLNHQPIRNFHKAMLNCLATEMRTPFAEAMPVGNKPDEACTNLSFNTVLRGPQ